MRCWSGYRGLVRLGSDFWFWVSGGERTPMIVTNGLG